jgi:hypothetical protein
VFRVRPTFLLAAMIAAGCASRKEPPIPRHPVAHELIRPLDAGTAKVLAVNERLRFVVLDYSLNPIPEFGRRLDVIRNGQKVGSLKVTGPVSGMTTAADLVAGEARAGDLARPEQP